MQPMHEGGKTNKLATSDTWTAMIFPRAEDDYTGLRQKFNLGNEMEAHNLSCNGRKRRVTMSLLAGMKGTRFFHFAGSRKWRTNNGREKGVGKWDSENEIWLKTEEVTP
ncbi:hypothetical protein CIPAW_15G124200 [Carya illinoinensis]|uniref:Uncharacterized protein n=1 Tax=Carya illinoinensis TaxID=32201 RepID=A0A8T1NEJ6_CARIL|nr:hypothetical protein CIPAW_15G124200 [Carya illinoinensis]